MKISICAAAIVFVLFLVFSRFQESRLPETPTQESVTKTTIPTLNHHLFKANPIHVNKASDSSKIHPVEIPTENRMPASDPYTDFDPREVPLEDHAESLENLIVQILNGYKPARVSLFLDREYDWLRQTETDFHTPSEIEIREKIMLNLSLINAYGETIEKNRLNFAQNYLDFFSDASASTNE